MNYLWQAISLIQHKEQLDAVEKYTGTFFLSQEY